MAKVLLITPLVPGVRTGNVVTAERWRRQYEELGHEASVATVYEGQDVDVLVALHARRSAAAVKGFAEAYPERPLVVVLTGTDIYGDLEHDVLAQESMAVASRLVVLQAAAPKRLNPEQRSRTWVIFQSMQAPSGLPTPSDDRLQVCVIGNLREVKDPFRMAAAARLLPQGSRVHVVHLGAAIDGPMAEVAATEDKQNERYEWRGPVEHAEAMRVLAASHLHVLTSHSEGGANVVVESLALGVPTITSAIDGSLGILGDDYPGVFKAGDTQALAREVLRFENEPEYRALLQEHCARRAHLVRPDTERAAWGALFAELGLESQMSLPTERFQIQADEPRDTNSDFAADVRTGLSADPKWFSCRWLYDAPGSAIFEEICALPEYYPTRAEIEILREQGDSIAARLGAELAVVELGSGSAVKARLVLSALLRERESLLYVPVDISRSAVEASSAELLAEFDQLEVFAIAGEYARGFEWMAANADKPKLLLWLGSNVGNYTRQEAAVFLSEIRGFLSPEDRVLLGVDLRKDARTLELAYDDPAGVTARFSKNGLARMNRELGANFDLDAFRHEVHYDQVGGSVQTYMRSLRDQQVRIEALDLVVEFGEYERMHMEDSYKYSFTEINTLAAEAGFQSEQCWLDRAEYYSLNLLRPR
ncbi:MAG: dimethylhistidine N-methyltransferase [Planctomycetota bacterium]|jgi:dimethylhistidine N-methyltransferase